MPSILGFPVGFTAEEIDVRSFPVPGSDVTLQVRADIAPLLLGVAADFHRTVAPLIPGQCGGWNPRNINGSTHWSRHACGIAIDLDSVQFAQGTRRMTAEQERASRAIAAKYGCRWGGDYIHSSVDQMHFEINRPIAEAQKLAGSPIAPAKPVPAPADTAVLSITVAGPNRLDELQNALTESQLTRTIEGASSIAVTVRDRKRTLLRGWGANLMSARVQVDGVIYQLAGVRKKGDELTLTFEDQIAATLRQQTGFRLINDRTTSRTEFIRILLSDPKSNVSTRWIKFTGEDRPVTGIGPRNLFIPGMPAVSRGTQDDPDGESTWDCSGRLAGELGWRRFSDGRQLIFGSDSWLRARGVPIPLSEFDAAGRPTLGVTGIDFNVDVGLPVSEVTVTCNFTRQSFPPGWPVALSGCGAADGPYVVKTTSRALHSPQGTVTLQRPLAEVVANIPRPANADDPLFIPLPPDPAVDVVYGAALKPKAIAEILFQAGFRYSDLITAVAVAYAESGGDPSKVGGPNKDGTYDRGLMQINDIHRLDWHLLVSDANYNAGAAFRIYSDAGNTFRDWVQFNNGSYRAFISNATLGVRQAGHFDAPPRIT